MIKKETLFVNFLKGVERVKRAKAVRNEFRPLLSQPKESLMCITDRSIISILNQRIRIKGLKTGFPGERTPWPSRKRRELISVSI